MRIVLSITLLLLLSASLGWRAFQRRPAPYPVLPVPARTPATLPLLAGLPAPVARFYRLRYGDQVPLIETAVITGRGTMRLLNLPVPIRFRFTHEAGRNYRHEIELAPFGVPLMRGDETYIDGRGWARTPGGVDEGAGFDQGSNVSLWVEALTWFPAVLVTDQRVRWQAVDDATALLVVPFGSGRETITVRFDPTTGAIEHVEAIKFKSATGKMTRWVDGTWADEGRPWIQLEVEELVYNIAVTNAIRNPSQAR